MKRLKTYSLFLESESYNNALKDSEMDEDYSILDWFEDLKSDNWNPSNIERHKVWCEHFVGEGWWHKVTSHVDRLFDILSDVNINHINDAMLDVFDTIPDQKERNIYTAVLYGDYDRINDSIDLKFSGTMPVVDLKNENRKKYIIISILIAIVHPTLYYSRFKEEASFRDGNESLYVTDKKWQCQNFDFEQFHKTGHLRDYEFSKVQKYSPENVLSMYRPGIVINIGGWGSDSRYTGEMYLDDLEEALDAAIEVVESEIDYEGIIWPYTRGQRHYDTTKPIYEYDLKILLKM
jgi:hypothetical protein